MRRITRTKIVLFITLVIQYYIFPQCFLIKDFQYHDLTSKIDLRIIVDEDIIDAETINFDQEISVYLKSEHDKSINSLLNRDQLNSKKIDAELSREWNRIRNLFDNEAYASNFNLEVLTPKDDNTFTDNSGKLYWDYDFDYTIEMDKDKNISFSTGPVIEEEMSSLALSAAFARSNLMKDKSNLENTQRRVDLFNSTKSFLEENKSLIIDEYKYLIKLHKITSTLQNCFLKEGINVYEVNFGDFMKVNALYTLPSGDILINRSFADELKTNDKLRTVLFLHEAFHLFPIMERSRIFNALASELGYKIPGFLERKKSSSDIFNNNDDINLIVFTMMITQLIDYELTIDYDVLEFLKPNKQLRETYERFLFSVSGSKENPAFYRANRVKNMNSYINNGGDISHYIALKATLYEIIMQNYSIYNQNDMKKMEEFSEKYMPLYWEKMTSDIEGYKADDSLELLRNDMAFSRKYLRTIVERRMSSILKSASLNIYLEAWELLDEIQ